MSVFTTPDYEANLRAKRAERGVSWEQYASEIETDDPKLAAWMRAEHANDVPVVADSSDADQGDADSTDEVGDETPAGDADQGDADSTDEVGDETPVVEDKPKRERAPRGRRSAAPSSKA